jgi:hypothetical protein
MCLIESSIAVFVRIGVRGQVPVPPRFRDEFSVGRAMTDAFRRKAITEARVLDTRQPESVQFLYTCCLA